MIASYRDTIRTLIRGETFKNSRLNANYEQYILWMSFRFVGNMTLENYAENWHVDHVLPLHMMTTKMMSKISFEDEDLDCLLCWFNTAPIHCKTNLQKNKYLDKKQLANHLRELDTFLKKFKKDVHIKLCDKYYTYRKIAQKLLDSPIM